jgi:hypothetical protein
METKIGDTATMKATLVEAIGQMLTSRSVTGLNDYTVAMFILGCVMHDVRLQKKYELPGYPMFAQLLNERDAAFEAGDETILCSLRTAARRALEFGRDQALELAVKAAGATGAAN